MEGISGAVLIQMGVQTSGVSYQSERKQLKTLPLEILETYVVAALAPGILIICIVQ